MKKIKLTKDELDLYIALIEQFRVNIKMKCKFYSDFNIIDVYGRNAEKDMHNILLYLDNTIFNNVDKEIYQQIEIKLNLIFHINGHSNAFRIKNEYNKYSYYNIYDCINERISDLIRYLEIHLMPKLK